MGQTEKRVSNPRPNNSFFEVRVLGWGIGIEHPMTQKLPTEGTTMQPQGIEVDTTMKMPAPISSASKARGNALLQALCTETRIAFEDAKRRTRQHVNPVTRREGERTSSSQSSRMSSHDKARLSSLGRAQIMKIRDICDEIRAEHLNVKVPPCRVEASTGKPASRGSIRYQHIYEDDDVTIGVFILPFGSRLPLHNHPYMSVFSKVLYGKLQMTQMDVITTTVSVNPGDGGTRGDQENESRAVGTSARGDSTTNHLGNGNASSSTVDVENHAHEGNSSSRVNGEELQELGPLDVNKFLKSIGHDGASTAANISELKQALVNTIMSEKSNGAIDLLANTHVPRQAALSELVLAQERTTRVISAPHTLLTLPLCGNLHEFEAVSPEGVAVLDILTPSYDECGRDCTYYDLLSSIKIDSQAATDLDVEDQSTYHVLRSRAYPPDDLHIVEDTYEGPVVDAFFK